MGRGEAGRGGAGREKTSSIIRFLFENLWILTKERDDKYYINI